MSLQRKTKIGRYRRALRVRARVGCAYPRVSVFRSLNHMYAQLIDDAKHQTLASCSTHDAAVGDVSGKKERAFIVGKELARRARDLGIEKVIFDRGAFLYHGRVKAVADGLRDGGLQV